MLLPLLPWELVRFNGAPDRNPGKVEPIAKLEAEIAEFQWSPR